MIDSLFNNMPHEVTTAPPPKKKQIKGKHHLHIIVEHLERMPSLHKIKGLSYTLNTQGKYISSQYSMDK